MYSFAGNSTKVSSSFDLNSPTRIEKSTCAFTLLVLKAKLPKSNEFSLKAAVSESMVSLPYLKIFAVRSASSKVILPFPIIPLGRSTSEPSSFACPLKKSMSFFRLSCNQGFCLRHVTDVNPFSIYFGEFNLAFEFLIDKQGLSYHGIGQEGKFFGGGRGIKKSIEPSPCNPSFESRISLL